MSSSRFSPALARSIGAKIGVRIDAFSADIRASVITITAVSLPVLAVGVAGAVELVEVASAKDKLQTYVDSAAMVGARQLGTDGSSATTERSRLVADNLADALRPRWSVATTAQADPTTGSMTVTQAAARPSMFGSLLPPGGFHLTATATATSNSTVPLCVLGTQAGGGPIVNLTGSSVLTAGSCLVQSDSDVAAAGSSRVQAAAVRAVGNATGSIAPAPLTDAPAIPDPFAALAINVPTTCNDINLSLLGGTTTLNPGVHCGTIQLLGTANLILNPGEHYFVGGSLTLLGSTQLSGTDVVLIFKGQSVTEFIGSSVLSLEGRKSGPYAGFVIISDRSFAGSLAISTSNAKKLLGTIYLPNGTLAVSGSGNKVADQSPWTVVVAKGLSIAGSANLVINSSYFTTSVPVPSGVGPGGLRLAQ